MASRKALAVAAVIAVALLPATAVAVVYRVGDDSGWDTGIDYAAWAKGKQFRAGDTLEFLYAEGSHNVVEVDGPGFAACSAAGNAPTWGSGDNKIVLERAGQRRFICSVEGHCQAGMKLAVTVH